MVSNMAVGFAGSVGWAEMLVAWDISMTEMLVAWDISMNLRLDWRGQRRCSRSTTSLHWSRSLLTSGELRSGIFEAKL